MKLLSTAQLVLRIAVTLSARVWIEISSANNGAGGKVVTLSARVWIEIQKSQIRTETGKVTLSARVWIEISSLP